MAGDSFKTFDGDAECSAPSPISPLNISALVVVAIAIAMVGADIINPAELMLAAILATGTAWGIRRAGQTRLSKTSAIGLMSGLFPFIIAVFVLRSFVAEPFAIPSGSMMPTLQEGDFILVNKHAYGLRMPLGGRKVIETGQPARGDVAVFRFPNNPKTDYIKRVIGLPGDLVVYANKELAINGRRAQYADIDVFGGFADSWTPRRGLSESIDGRTHSILHEPGTQPYIQKQVQSFPFQENCSYRPAGFACRVPAGHYLVMGDNRDASHDSRYWGFVPDENLVGRASIIWMNVKRPGRIGLRID